MDFVASFCADIGHQRGLNCSGLSINHIGFSSIMRFGENALSEYKYMCGVSVRFFGLETNEPYFKCY